jgi:hypothetical protein
LRFDDLETDPVAARIGKDDRHRRFNTVQLPAMRALGFTLILGAALLHNALLPLTVAVRLSMPACAVIAGLYSVVSWAALCRWYEPGGRLPLGQAFLFSDVAVMALAVYATGGTDSLLFPVFMVRVADQIHGTSRRLPLVFAHVNVGAYVCVILFQRAVDGVVIQWNLEIERVPFNPPATLDDSADQVADQVESRQIDLVCLMGPGVPETFEGDPGRLRQVLVNLLANAVKFTERGHVELRVSRDGASLRFEIAEAACPSWQ